MTANASRNARGLIQRSAGRLGAVVALSMIMGGIVPLTHGFSAAAGTAETTSKGPVINLAGRWQGPHHSYNLRSPAAEDCGGKPCQLTYDIVACPQGWCGIVVTDATPCGTIGLHLKGDPDKKRRNAFMGQLELAKGSASYTVEAWYDAPGATAGEGSEQPRLNFVGDTGGGGMLMMRRSFPFQAELARIGDGQCTLEKATS
jgi:hypothetical protein